MSLFTSMHCRLCAGRKPRIEIVDLSSNIQIRNEIIDKLAIFSVDTVDFTDQTLPETICSTCRDSVRISYDFFRKIKHSQLELKNLQNVAYSTTKQRIFNSSEVKDERNHDRIKEEKLFDPFNDEESHNVECSGVKMEFDDGDENVDEFPSNSEASVSRPLPVEPTPPLTTHQLSPASCRSLTEIETELTEDAVPLPTMDIPQTQTNVPARKNRPKTKNSESEDDRFQCTSCGKSFNTWKELQHHTSTDNDHVKRKRTKATIEELTCDICFKVFSIPAKLRYHKVKHTDRSRDYVCDVCGKAFYAKDSLNTHKIIHNPESQDCKICKKTFISLIRLRKHLKTHDVSKPFECNECHRRFRMKYQLGKHMVVHSNVFPYSCEYCKKGFRFKNVLKTHENIHTGAKPFVCSVCGMDFTNWSNCNKHMVRKHGVSLAKRVKTAHGMMPLNQETLKPKEVDLESVKWSEQMCKPRKRGRKKQEDNPT